VRAPSCVHAVAAAITDSRGQSLGVDLDTRRTCRASPPGPAEPGEAR